MNRPAARMLIAGTHSGCGKTTVTCALLQALIDRGEDVMSYKCGPDYIDPMFHSDIIGADSANIDIYLAGRETAKMLFLKHARDLNIIEGVMGYYDGVAMDSDEASSYDVGRLLNAPTILVVNGRGMALSAAAVVKGFLELRRDSGIAGVILNHVSPMLMPQLKRAIESECGIKVYGCLPRCPEAELGSRHLGLVTAQEVDDLRQKLSILGKLAEEHIDIDGLIELMRAQPPLSAERPLITHVANVRIAVARDRAFCFYYRDNLELLQDMGAELVYFSPLEDAALPECDGLYIGGGYPELYAEALSRNESMRTSILAALRNGLPAIAECGGYMYLTESIDGHAMVGMLPGHCRDMAKLVRFGYNELSADDDCMLLNAGESIRAHEFHYWDCDAQGDALTAKKPSGRSWRFGYADDDIYAGFPHLYFYSNRDAAARFIFRCAERS